MTSDQQIGKFAKKFEQLVNMDENMNRLERETS